MLNDDPVSPSTTSEPVLESSQQAAHILIRNSTFYLGADAVIKILGFLFNVYVVRQLGDARFGSYSTALAYAGIFSIIGDLGMTQFATREIARGRRQADELFWDLVVVRLILSTLATIFITTSAAFIADYSSTMVLGIFLVCVSFYLYAFLGPVEIVLSGRERIDIVSYLDTIVQIFFVTVGTLVLVGEYSFHSLIVASYIGAPVAALIGANIIKRLKLATLKVKIHPQNWLLMLKYSLPFALITFTLVAAKDLDTVLISLWRSPEEVGWYKAAYNLTFKLLFIRGALLSTLAPQMSRYYGISKNRVAKMFNSSFKILWIFTFPMAIGVALLSKPIITWLYTEKFAHSGMALAILVWAIPFLNLSSLCGTITTATDKEKQAAKVYITAALLNLVSNVIVVPIWGYLGAAVNTVITELTALLLFYSVLHHEFPLTDLKNTLLKPLVAGIIMSGIVFILSDWPLFSVIVVGAVVYSVTLFALKPFNQAELEILQGLWQGLRRRLKMGN